MIHYPSAPDPREVSFFFDCKVGRSGTSASLSNRIRREEVMKKKDTACGQEDGEIRSGKVSALKIVNSE